MAQRIINNGDSGLTIRNNLNDNFTEIYNRLQQLEDEVPDENLAPTDITLSSSSIDEGNEIGDVIGTLLATDPDDGDTHTFELVAGTGDTDNLSFTIEGDQLKANEIFSYDVKTSYSIRIRATDQGGLFFDKQFEITIIEVPVLEFHPEIIAYTDGLTTPLDEGQKIRLNNLADELKTGLGLSSLDEAFDYFYVFGNDTDEVSVRNLAKRAHDCTPMGTSKLVWEEYKGYRDTSNEGHLRTNYNPAIDGVNFTKDSGSFGLRTFTMNTNTGTEMGCSDGTNRISIRLRSSGTPIYFNNNTSDGTSVGPGSGTPVGHIVSRNSANEFKYYREGVLEYTSSEPSVGVPNAEMQIIGYNNNGTPETFVQRQQFIHFMGRAFTDAEALVITNAINNYIGSLTAFNPNPASDIILSSTAYIEDNEIGEVLAELRSVDVNPTNTHTYTLVAGTGDTDNASFTIDGFHLKAAVVFDQAVKSSYSIRIRTTDNEGQIFEKAFAISILSSTITINNVITNGDFALDSNSDGTPDGVGTTSKAIYTLDSVDTAIAGNALKVELNPSTGDNNFHEVYLSSYNAVEGHKHYIGFWCKSGYPDSTVKTDNIITYAEFNAGGTNQRLKTPDAIEEGWKFCSVILPMGATSATTSSMFRFWIEGYQNRSAGEYFKLQGFYNIDLTDAFGAGNEPEPWEMDVIIRSLPYFSGTQVIDYSAAGMTTLKSTDSIIQARETRLTNGILRIATFNELSGHSHPYIVKQLVKELDLDILGSQEIKDAKRPPHNNDYDHRYFNNTLKYKYRTLHNTVAEPTWYNIYGVMASAFTLQNTELINAGSGIWYIIKATFEFNGQQISLYNTHLQNDDTNIPLMVSRVQAVYDKIALDTNEHIIVVGDFNNPTGASQEDRLDMTQQSMFTNGGFIDSFTWTPGGVKRNTYNQMPLGWSLLLDHVWVKGFNVIASGVKNAEGASDHNIVWMEAEMVLP